MKSIIFPLVALAVYFTSCGAKTTDSNTSESNASSSTSMPAETASISQGDTAKQGKTIIIDVRTVEEWNNDGHADCTVNIPLDQLESKMENYRNYDKVIFVCRSGGRAGRATEMFTANGYKNVSNAGPWQNAPCK
jgi:rhodanese-related sulfurtransferase